MYTPCRGIWVDNSRTNLCPTDLPDRGIWWTTVAQTCVRLIWAQIYPHRGIWRPIPVLCQVTLTFVHHLVQADLLIVNSVWFQVRHTLSPLSRGIWCPRDVLHHVSLTFGQHLGQADLLVVNSLRLDLSSDIPPPPYRHILCTFHISVFVNTTHMVVNSDTIVYMCMEVIICQSERSPERLMISQTPTIRGTSNHLRWEKECGGNSPSFWSEFCKTLHTQNGIFLTFQICGILDIPHVCICQYDKYSSKKLHSTEHICGSYDLSIWEVPWQVDNISDL